MLVCLFAPLDPFHSVCPLASDYGFLSNLCLLACVLEVVCVQWECVLRSACERVPLALQDTSEQRMICGRCYWRFHQQIDALKGTRC